MAINLLPLKEKRLVKGIYKAHRFIAGLIILNLLLLSGIVLIVALEVALKQEKASETKALSVLNEKSQVKEFNQLRDEVNLLNKIVLVAKNSLRDNLLPTENMAAILLAKPKGVGVTSVEYLSSEEQGLIVNLSGFAASREDLLAFTSGLEKLIQVKSVYSPVANLVGGANTPFTLKVVLNENITHE